MIYLFASNAFRYKNSRYSHSYNESNDKIYIDYSLERIPESYI